MCPSLTLLSHPVCISLAFDLIISWSHVRPDSVSLFDKREVRPATCQSVWTQTWVLMDFLCSLLHSMLSLDKTSPISLQQMNCLSLLWPCFIHFYSRSSPRPQNPMLQHNIFYIVAHLARFSCSFLIMHLNSLIQQTHTSFILTVYLASGGGKRRWR